MSGTQLPLDGSPPLATNGAGSPIFDPAQATAFDPLACPVPGCGKGPFKSKAGLGGHLQRSHDLKMPKVDKPPPAILIDLSTETKGAKGRDPALVAVEARAKQICQTVAALVLLAGQQGDALDIQNGADAWAAAVGNLAEHEEWLKKLAAGGEASARTLAWVQFAAATFAIALPILLRHDALPPKILAIATMFTSGAEALAPDGAPAAAAA